MTLRNKPEILLFIKDIQYATHISALLTQHNFTVRFVNEKEPVRSWFDPRTRGAVVDLNDPDYGNVHFISTLKYSVLEIFITGYVKQMQKLTVDKLRAAGCNLILPQSSFIKNIPYIAEQIQTHEVREVPQSDDHVSDE